MGVKTTYNHLLRYFFWPRLKRDVAAYIKTCHARQVTRKPNQAIKPAPLFPIPVVDNPFDHLIIDYVGPLPRSKFGSEYLLTVMCQITRYPAAYPLRTITAKSVVRALIQFIAIFGTPKLIQTDQGSNFSSNLLSQVIKQLNIKQNQASANHPQSQGALERFHQTLKSLVRAYCTEMERDWEEWLPWLLLAAREVCHESRGEQVLALLPVVGVPFQATFVGPYTIVRQLSEQNSLIATPDRRKKNQLCHVNLLKSYYARASSQALDGGSNAVSAEVKPVLASCTVEQSAFSGGGNVAVPDDSVLCGRLKNSESLQNLDALLSHLSVKKRTELTKLIQSYPSLFGDTPSKTNLMSAMQNQFVNDSTESLKRSKK